MSDLSEEQFDKFQDEYLKFGRIPENEKVSPMRDLCGMLFLANLLIPESSHLIAAAEHDEIFFHGEFRRPLSYYDVMYLMRCGISYSADSDGLRMGA